MGKLLLCVVPRSSHLSEPCSGRDPPARVEARATKIAATTFAIHRSPILSCAGRGGGRLPIHVMIATLPIAAALGELGGVCHHLNQSHHSRVSPPPLSGLWGNWWSVWKLPKLA